MPFAGYTDFDDCVAQNQDKSDPEAYCAAIQRQVEEDMAELTAPMVFKDDEKQIVYGPVLVPDEPDSDGDKVTEEHIEAVAHGFLKQYGNIDLRHSLNNVGSTVESYIAPMDLTFEDITVPKGSWIMGVHVSNKDAWDDVKKGKLQGFSIMGVPNSVKKSAESDEAVEKGSSRTTLADLGEDWIVNAVSLVEEPAVPKAKWVAIKSKPGEHKEPTQETVTKAISGSLEHRRQVVQSAVWHRFESGDTMADVIATTEDSVVVRLWGGGPWAGEKTVQVSYTLNDDGTVEFTGDPQEVRIEENVVPVEGNGAPATLSREGEPEQESWSQKMKRFLPGSQKAGRSISDKNLKKLKSAKEVIDELLELGENERSGKSTESRDGDEVMKEEDWDGVRQVFREELAAHLESVNKQSEEAPASTEEAPADDSASKASSEEAPAEVEPASKGVPSEGEGEEQTEETEFAESLNALVNKSRPLSKRLNGQDSFGEDEANKSKSQQPARDAFGFKVKQ